MTTLILKTTSRVVLPLIILYSFALFLQGHSLPGGGFIAGVLTSIGITLVYLAYDIDYLEEHILNEEDVGIPALPDIVDRYRTVFGAGLSLILVSGLVSVALGFPFLTQDYTEAVIPVYGHVELASAVVFDLGVYAVVVGALLTVISVMGGSS
ncbi:MAG: MnhB domain-containing protein [Halobacteria archaeon]|nr:MnhB domain-containing protein [Halobacteria archaeon]